jgi:hypothetical protein
MALIRLDNDNNFAFVLARSLANASARKAIPTDPPRITARMSFPPNLTHSVQKTHSARILSVNPSSLFDR